MGGGCLIGWLPEVVGNETDKRNGTKWSEFQSLVYQQAMGEILSSLRHAAHWGIQIRCADGILRRVYPFILGLIADNQESWTMLAMRGANALKPCAICRVPRDALHRLNVKHPRRSKLESCQIIQKAQTMGKGPAEDFLRSYGLRAH